MEKENDMVQVNLAYKYYIQRNQHLRPYLGQWACLTSVNERHARARFAFEYSRYRLVRETWDWKKYAL